jgi:beta-lactamase superfamily II metal-dependent hydrolase
VLARDTPESTSAVPELLRRYRVAQIVAAEEPSADADWRTSVDRARIPIVTPDESSTLPLDGGATLSLLTVAAPRRSLGLVLAVGPTRVLVLGDSATAGQRAVAELLDAPVDVVQLSAEGSGTLDPALRDRADPPLALVRVRPNLPPRVPIARPDDRLQVLRSDEHGTVELILRPSGLQIRTRR